MTFYTHTHAIVTDSITRKRYTSRVIKRTDITVRAKHRNKSTISEAPKWSLSSKKGHLASAHTDLTQKTSPTISRASQSKTRGRHEKKSIPFAVDFNIPVVKVVCGDLFSVILTAEG